MNEMIFKAFVEPKNPTKRWFFFPVSLLFHGLLIGAIVVVPLLTAESMPPAKIFDVFVVAPPAPPPAPPPPPKARKSTKGPVKTNNKPEETKPVTQGRFVAPVDVPSEIEDEDISDFGFNGGVPGGVAGGIEGGVPGGVLGSLAGADDPSQLTIQRISPVQRPKLIRRVTPQYPPTALKARLQGVVIVEAVTDIYGRVIKARIINGHPLFRNSAMEAVKRWVYEPYIIDGIPKPVVFTVTVHFRLNGVN